MGLPVICIDARHAKAALKMQINKSDRNDAVGIARIMQFGWYKEVRIEIPTAWIKARLVSRARRQIKRDIENQIAFAFQILGSSWLGKDERICRARRGAGRCSASSCSRRRTAARGSRRCGRQIADLVRKVLRLARIMSGATVHNSTRCWSNHSSLLPGDDRRPHALQEVAKCRSYAGLTTRRYASGEIDWTGRISKCGDKMLRTYLYEAANVLLTRIEKWSALKAWGIRLAKRSGLRKAKVAVARKLAVILHRMWIEGTEFKWSSKEAANQPA